MPRSNQTSSERKEYLRNAEDLEPLTQPLTGGRFNPREIADTFVEYREDDLPFTQGLETELEPHDFGNPTDTWLPPLRVLLTRILLLVRLLFVVNHESNSDEYIEFVTRVLVCIVHLCNQICVKYFRCESILRNRIRQDTISEVSTLIVSVVRPGTFEADYRRRARGTFEVIQNETNPFLQWCSLYYSPTVCGPYHSYVLTVRRYYDDALVQIRQSGSDKYNRYLDTSKRTLNKWPPGFDKDNHAGSGI